MFAVSRCFLEASKETGFSVEAAGKTEIASPGSIWGDAVSRNSQKSSGGFPEVPSALPSAGSSLPGSVLVSAGPGQLTPVTPASPTLASSHAAPPPGLGLLCFTHPALPLRLPVAPSGAHSSDHPLLISLSFTGLSTWC